MLPIVFIGLTAALLASPPEPGPSAEWIYNGVDRPAMIDIAGPPEGAEDASLTLALMDAHGELLVRPAAVRPGRADLAELIPDIWRLRRAAYLQLLAGGEPIGSALVVQPMLSRLIPVTEEATSPGGAGYRHIIGWRDARAPREAYDADDPKTGEETSMPEPAGGATATDADSAAPAEPEPAAGPSRAWLAVPGADHRLLSGVRLYRERDVILHTTEGDIRLALRPDHAPNTVFNFIRLCEGGFYRDVAFHRVVPMTREGEPFIIQAGDPTGLGDGGPGYRIDLEPSGLPHEFGVISMARDADPDTAGSQFFICLSREGTARLDGDYCAFGYAMAGRDAILAIADVELADLAAGRPVEAPRIESAELVPAPPRVVGLGRPDRPIEPAPLEAEQPAEARPGRVPR
ncbi:MAG: peptidylprolyl isomerase [Planctomycetota bacterium]|nr:peptidylprolyl isomerase [Planctomycetota bacterium]